MKEIKPLTSLRALAAFLVFMYHYAWLFPPAERGVAFAGQWVPFMFLWRQGQVGVSIFFVLSGFLITRIYADKMARGETPLRLYFVKRVARIWPLFLCLAVIQHGVRWITGHPPDATWLVTMSMTQGFFPNLQYDGLPTAWSLTIEETFYVLAPLLFLLLARTSLTRRRTSYPRLLGVLALVALALFAAGLVMVWSVGRWGWTWQGFMGSVKVMFHTTLCGRFPEFAIGVAAAFIHRDGKMGNILSGRRADMAALLLFLGIAGCMGGLTPLKAAHTGMAALGVNGLFYLLSLFAGMLILTLTVPGGLIHRVLSLPLPVFLGRISYGFYLIQLSVIMTPLVNLSDRLGWARLPVLLVLTNLVCAALYLLVENPARRSITTRWGGPSMHPRQSP